MNNEMKVNFTELAKADRLELKEFKRCSEVAKQGYNKLINAFKIHEEFDITHLLELLISLQDKNEKNLEIQNESMRQLMSGFIPDCKGLKDSIKACKLKIKYLNEHNDVCHKSVKLIMSKNKGE